LPSTLAPQRRGGRWSSIAGQPRAGDEVGGDKRDYDWPTPDAPETRAVGALHRRAASPAMFPAG
jgi:hypothetical protein